MIRKGTSYRPFHVDPTEDRPDVPGKRGASDRPTFGSIVWYAMLRLVLTIAAALMLYDRVDYSEWWWITIAGIYGFVVFPAQVQYNHFRQSSRQIIEETLCSSCRFFNPDGLHCTKLDEHVSERYLPCEGEGWEPQSFGSEE